MITMKTKSLSLTILSSLALSSVACAASALRLSDDAQIHVLGDLAYTFEDNLFLSGEGFETSAHSLEFSPGLELRLAEKGTASAMIRYQHRFEVFLDEDDLDGDYADLELKAKYDSGVLMAAAHASYEQKSSQTLETAGQGRLIERDEIGAGVDLRYEISELLAVGGGLLYDETDYEDDNRYTDSESYSAPLTLIYKFRPKLELNAGVRYRVTEADALNTDAYTFDSTDMYYFIGAVGELFTPVLYGDVSIGFQERELDDFDSDTSSGSYNATVTYVGDPKTTVYVSFSRDYRTSGVGASTYAYTSAKLGARYNLSKFVGLTASVTAAETDYKQSVNFAGMVFESNRQEDLMYYNLGVTLNPNDYFTLRASYQYQDADRDPINDFTNNKFRVSASLRY